MNSLLCILHVLTVINIGRVVGTILVIGIVNYVYYIIRIFHINTLLNQYTSTTVLFSVLFLLSFWVDNNRVFQLPNYKRKSGDMVLVHEMLLNKWIKYTYNYKSDIYYIMNSWIKIYCYNSFIFLHSLKSLIKEYFLQFFIIVGFWNIIVVLRKKNDPAYKWIPT